MAFAALIVMATTSGCATLAQHAETRRALEHAEKEINATALTGHLWRIRDHAAGDSPQDLEVLLSYARRLKREDIDESLRIAKRIIWAARAGRRQAQQQLNAAPVYR